MDVVRYGGVAHTPELELVSGDCCGLVPLAEFEPDAQAGHAVVSRLERHDTPLGDGGAGLSGGQKQRLGLARALYGDPALVILDEPNANLDDAGEAALLEAIEDLARRQRTVVIISHRTPVLSLTSQLLLLREGQTQLFGPTAQVLAQLRGARRPAPAPANAAPSLQTALAD